MKASKPLNTFFISPPPSAALSCCLLIVKKNLSHQTSTIYRSSLVVQCNHSHSIGNLNQSAKILANVIKDKCIFHEKQMNSL
jgi:hypothetical protein